MSISTDLGQKRSPITRIASLPWWGFIKGSATFSVLCVMFSQCMSLGILAKNSGKAPVLQVGKNAEIVEIEELPEEENRKLFVQEALELMLTSSPWVPKELDEQCSIEPNCTQAKARLVPSFGHELPEIQGYAMYLASIEYQPAFIKSAIANRPEGFERGESAVYRVGFVGDPTPVNGRAETFQSVVRGSTLLYNAKDELIGGVRDNRLVTFRAVAKPTGRKKNLAQQEAIEIRKRGYEISLIQPILEEGQ